MEEEIVSDEIYRYWYGSLKGAINLLYYNSRNSSKTRFERGRVSAGIHEIKTDDILDLWDKQDGKCAYSGIPLNYDINSHISFFDYFIEAFWEAHQLYLKFRNDIDIEKKGGPKVDFGDIKCVERKK